MYTHTHTHTHTFTSTVDTPLRGLGLGRGRGATGGVLGVESVVVWSTKDGIDSLVADG